MTSTFVNHCIKMYETLNDLAVDKPVSDGTARVFTGSYTDAWKATKIAQSYYTPVRKSLEKHGAIQILQKGGRSVDTVIVLLGLPDMWSVDGWKDGTDLTNSTVAAKIGARVEELQKSTGGMNIVKALQELENRLNALEEKVELLTIDKE